MKFSAAVILAALGFADAKLNILSKAIPVHKDGSIRKAARQLNQEQYQLTAYNTLVFNECISMKVNSADLQSAGIYELAAAGKVVAQQSYVMFNVVSTGDEYYEEGSDENLWMIPLDDWLQSLGQQGQNNDQQYCKVCQKSQAYCPADEAVEDAQNGGRKLAQYEWMIEVECEVCEQKGCFDDNNNNQDDGNFCDQDAYVEGCTFKDEDLQQFIAKEAACSGTGQIEYINEVATEVMAGFMCNEKGDGIEVAMFLDDACTLYDKSKNFGKLMEGTYLHAALEEAATKIQAPYQDPVKCMKYEYVAIGNQNNQNQNNNNNQNPQVNKICQNILKKSYDLETCLNANQGNQQQQNQQNSNVDMSFYQYDIEENTKDQVVCLKLQENSGEFSGYRVYETKNQFGGSGIFYDYSKQSSTNDKKGAKAGKVIGIIALVAVVVVGGIFAAQFFAKKGDNKKVPLVGNKAAISA